MSTKPVSEIRADLAGSVWRVEVEEGQRVSAGQCVVVMETMKMEIPRMSDRDGRIVEVRVAPGGFVAEGEVMVVVA